MPTDRAILHCDMNGFFASVEMLEHPELRGRPVAVSGNPLLRHGIILAKNEAAKKFGIATGETIGSAKQKCPDLTLLEPHHEKYAHYSKLANAIYARFTDKVEPFGIDESWLDVSASRSLFGDPKTIADTIRETIKRELNLTVSVGVSFNKVFAKLGSDYKKPDATTVFNRDSVEKIIHRLPVKSMLFVGRNTAAALAKMNIRTIGDLAAFDVRVLSRKFGKHGALLHEYATGNDTSPVAQYGVHDPVKSIGNSITFSRDLSGERDIKLGLAKVAEKVSQRLIRKGLKGDIVHLSIKGADFSYLTRQRKIEMPTNLASTLSATAMELVLEAWNLAHPIRMLGIACSGVESSDTPIQADFFANDTPREEARTKAFFAIKEQFGDNTINFGSQLDSDLQ